MPAKVKRELSDTELAWKLEGTLTYQDLTRRCLDSLVEVAPLPAIETGRPRVKRMEVKSLIETRRDSAGAA
ncbi:Carnitine operon protein CaiE [compost metagenome]